jgi:hypothetical protein
VRRLARDALGDAALASAQAKGETLVDVQVASIAFATSDAAPGPPPPTSTSSSSRWSPKRNMTCEGLTSFVDGHGTVTKSFTVGERCELTQVRLGLTNAAMVEVVEKVVDVDFRYVD